MILLQLVVNAFLVLRGLWIHADMRKATKLLRSRIAQIDELKKDHHEIRMLFAAQADKDINNAEQDYFNQSPE